MDGSDEPGYHTGALRGLQRLEEHREGQEDDVNIRVDGIQVWISSCFVVDAKGALDRNKLVGLRNGSPGLPVLE